MKRKNTISTVLTDEEYEKFRDAWLDAESRSGTRINVSKFIRDTILTSINGDCPPSVPETRVEPDKNVSPPTYDKVTEGYKPDSEQETDKNVSPESTHTLSLNVDEDSPWDKINIY